jgi:two-component system, sensor histidine kinase LadS
LHSFLSLKTWQILAIAFVLIAAIFWSSLHDVAPNEGQDKAPDYLLAQSYFVDAGGMSDFREAKAATFTPFTGAFVHGFSKGAVWLKLRVAAAQNERSLAVIVEPPFLQRLELFDPQHLTLANTKPVIGGRDHRSAEESFDGLANGFVIPTATADRDVYIRLTSSTSILAQISVMPLAQARQADTSTLVVVAIYLALLAMFAFWGCINFIIKRESIYLYFTIRQLSSIAHALAFFGLLRIFLGQDTSTTFLNFIYTIIIATLVTFNGIFDLKMISKFNPSLVFKNIYSTILFLPFFNVLLIFAGHNHEAIFLSHLVACFGVIALLVLAWSAKSMSQTPMEILAIKVIRIGYLITTLTVLFPIFIYFGLLPGQPLLVKPVFFHAIISSVVMLTLLMIDSRNRELAYQEAQMEIQLKDVALRNENKRRADKERFLSMIIHELRNPLSVIRLLTDKATHKGMSVHQAVMDMTHLIQRVEQSEKLASGDLLIEREPVDLADTVQRLVSVRQEAKRWKVSAPPAVAAHTDPQLLKGILNNLFDNAEKYSPPGSRLSMRFEHNSGSPPENIMAISNEVGTLNAPNLDLIFDRYYRGTGAHYTPGSGLGLFLVKGWVKALEGSIECALSTTADNKSVFTVTLRFAS